MGGAPVSKSTVICASRSCCQLLIWKAEKAFSIKSKHFCMWKQRILLMCLTYVAFVFSRLRCRSKRGTLLMPRRWPDSKLNAINVHSLHPVHAWVIDRIPSLFNTQPNPSPFYWPFNWMLHTVFFVLNAAREKDRILPGLPWLAELMEWLDMPRDESWLVFHVRLLSITDLRLPGLRSVRQNGVQSWIQRKRYCTETVEKCFDYSGPASMVCCTSFRCSNSYWPGHT